MNMYYKWMETSLSFCLMKQCPFCDNKMGFQEIIFPCGCIVFSHPECFADYTFRLRQKYDSVWKIPCLSCQEIVQLPNHSGIKIRIPEEKEEKEEKEECELSFITLITFISGLISYCAYRVIC